MKAGAEITQLMHNEFKDVSQTLAVKRNTFMASRSKTVPGASNHMAYVLKQPFEDVLDHL